MMKREKLVNFCEGVNYYSIIAVPFAVILGLGLANALIIIMAASFFIAKLLKAEMPSLNSPVNLAYGILLLAIILSFKNTLYLNNSIRGFERWLIEYPMIFLMVASGIKDIKHVKLVVISMAMSISILCVDSVWQLATGRDFIWGNIVQSSPILLARPTASFNNPNLLGIYLSMSTPVIAGIAFFCKRERSKIFVLLASILGMLGVSLTLSRGAGLGLWFALLFLAIMKKSRILAAVLIMALLVYPFVMPKNIKSWAKEINYNPAVFLFNYDRLSIHRNTINMIKHHPLVGVGINTFSKNYAKYKLAEPEYAVTGDTTYAHNIYLHTAGEIGLLGLGALLLFFFALFKQGFSVYSRLRDGYLKTISISILAGLIAFMINGMTETSLYHPTVVAIFWFLIGFSLALKKFVPDD